MTEIQDCKNCQEEENERKIVSKLIHKVDRLSIVNVWFLNVMEPNSILSMHSFLPLATSDRDVKAALSRRQKLRTQCGTVNYMSPELLLGAYGKPTDVWSYGVIVPFFIFADARRLRVCLA